MSKYPYQNTELKTIRSERWEDIPGFEMYFKVSNFGRIKRLEYELEYSDGRRYVKPEKIIKPVVMNIANRFMGDNVYFLRTTITLYKQKYNFSVARLVYACFNKPLKTKDEPFVILAKDGNGLNIKPSNLIVASLSEKQQRIFDLNRREPLVVDKDGRKRGIANSQLTNNKQVTQYTIQGKKVTTFPSIAAASKKTGISPSHISSRARGNEYSAGGFIWRFGNKPNIDIKPMLDAIAKRRRENREAFGKKVTQYTLNGHRVGIYPSITDAVKGTGIRHVEISKVIMQKKRFSAGGFYWQGGEGPAFIDLTGYDFGEVLRSKNKQRPVWQYSKDGGLLKRFDSIKQAAELVGVNSSTIIGALRGYCKTAGGFIWRYA